MLLVAISEVMCPIRKEASCRLCLSKKSIPPLLDLSENNSLASLITRVLSLRFSLSRDKLRDTSHPRHVCHACHDTIQAFIKLRDLARKNEESYFESQNRIVLSRKPDTNRKQLCFVQLDGASDEYETDFIHCKKSNCSFKFYGKDRKRKMYTHLLTKHFKSQISQLMPAPVGDTYHCNQDGCQHKTKLKSNLLQHIGISHKIITKFLLDERNERSDNALLPAPTVAGKMNTISDLLGLETELSAIQAGIQQIDKIADRPPMSFETGSMMPISLSNTAAAAASPPVMIQPPASAVPAAGSVRKPVAVMSQNPPGLSEFGTAPFLPPPPTHPKKQEPGMMGGGDRYAALESVQTTYNHNNNILQQQQSNTGAAFGNAFLDEGKESTCIL